MSLNDRLKVGGNYMPLLFDTIMRFRVNPIAITADIEKAFLQIEIQAADRDVLRFLWYDDVNSPNPSIVQFRFRRLVLGLTCSPALLGQTIRHHIEQYREESPEIVYILSRLYADDLSCGAKNREEGFDIYRKTKVIMLKGGFNLRKWHTNDKVLQSKILKQENKSQVNESHGNKIVEDDQTFSQYSIGSTLSYEDSTSFRGELE